MKKIKRFWAENKVLFVLAIIIIICFAIIVGVTITYFYGSSESVYGDRLDDIEDTPVSDEVIASIESSLEVEEEVSKVSINVQGKIIYISISYVDETEIDTAKKIAESVIDLFSEDILELYDVQFTISSLSTNDFVGYTIMGARNATGNGVVWGNYNTSSDEEE